MDTALSKTLRTPFALSRTRIIPLRLDPSRRCAVGVEVSVIVPTHNRADSLLRHIAAVLAQDHPAFETLYIDDASTDNTANVLAKAAEQHGPRLRTLRMPQQSGPAAARNKGAELAQGEWLAFLDDDALPPPEWLGGMIASAKKHGVQVLCGGVQPLRMKTRPEQYLHWRFQAPLGPRPKRLRAAPSCNLLISRAVFEETQGFRTPPVPAGEDWELTLRLRNRHHAIFYDPAPGVTHSFRSRWANVTPQIRATGAAGIWIARLHGYPMTAYLAYSALRALASPLWTPFYYPLALWPRAVQMELLLLTSRLSAWRKGLHHEGPEPPSNSA